jgi:hypothetical protein
MSGVCNRRKNIIGCYTNVDQKPSRQDDVKYLAVEDKHWTIIKIHIGKVRRGVW